MVRAPPWSRKASLVLHAIVPGRSALYLCQHAVRSKIPAWRGATEVGSGFAVWKADGLPMEGGPRPRAPDDLSNE